MAISLRNGVSGTATNTVITITLPTYQLTDYIILFLSSNNANAQTFSSAVTATALGTPNNRLNAWKIVPINGSQTSFTVTVGTNSIFTWWIGAYQNVDLTAVAYATTVNPGNSTTSALEMPAAPTNIIANGTELVLSVGAVNSTATWTTTASTIYNTTTGNAALMVNSDLMTSGSLTATPAAMDRGNNTSSRNESAAVVILQTTPNAPVNILANASFEDNAAVSASWATESTTIGTPAFTKLSTGAIDGAKVQQMQYAGQTGDTGKIFAIYQSPITSVPGDVLTFTIYLAGSKANCDLIIGIEGFSTGQVYISETDTYITALTSTMTQYSVTYTCPATTVAVAVYIQANALTPTTSATIQMDKAILSKASATGKVKTPTTSKPIKIWNGSAWVIKPIKRWNGSTWVLTP